MITQKIVEKDEVLNLIDFFLSDEKEVKRFDNWQKDNIIYIRDYFVVWWSKPQIDFYICSVKPKDAEEFNNLEDCQVNYYAYYDMDYAYYNMGWRYLGEEMSMSEFTLDYLEELVSHKERGASQV